MKEEIITPYMGGDVMVYEKPIPTKIPKGKTPVRGVGLSTRKSTSRNNHLPLLEVIYDKVVFIDTEQLSSSYGNIQTFVGNKMTKLNLGYVSEIKREGRPKRTPLELKCLNLWGCGFLQVHFNVFNIEENKWEGFDVRKGTK
jgi:hypothetical protein